MASASLSSSALSLSKSLAPSDSSCHTPQTFLNSKNYIRISQIRRSPSPLMRAFSVKSEFGLTFIERDLQDSDGPPPPGLPKYESMVVLRPDMSEDERLAFTQKYEELLVAGGGVYVEVFNRGVTQMAHAIRKKNKAGESNTYLDGIYLLFTYFTKPDSLSSLGDTLLADDNVIRSSTFKVRKRKMY